MGDCLNAEMRDLLPDLLYERLSATDRVALESHLATCDACRAELALLARVREAALTPRVDVAAIVNALPAYQRRPARRAALMGVAAAVVFLAGTATLLLRGPSDEPRRVDTVAQAAAVTPPVLSLGESFQDLSDSDLEALAEQLQDLDAMLSEEPDEITVPIGSTES